MRLLTHNSLRCAVKGATEGYPLGIDVKDVQQQETEFNEKFIQSIAPQLNWAVLKDAARQVGIPADALPERLTPQLLADTSFLQALHRCIMDVHVVTGELVCPETGRRFAIEHGIPNMMVQEEEVDKIL